MLHNLRILIEIIFLIDKTAMRKEIILVGSVRVQ